MREREALTKKRNHGFCKGSLKSRRDKGGDVTLRFLEGRSLEVLTKFVFSDCRAPILSEGFPEIQREILGKAIWGAEPWGGDKEAEELKAGLTSLLCLLFFSFSVC